MVYAGNFKQQNLTIGVSGRLDKSNLVMWDPQTNSLWAQLTGEAVHGPLKGRSLELKSALFLPLSAWLKRQPKSRVLDISAVRNKGWYFQGRHFQDGQYTYHSRRGGSQVDKLGLAVRSATKQLLVSVQRLHKEKLIVRDFAGTKLLFLWLENDRTALVYKAPQDSEFKLEGKVIAAKDGTSWDALLGKKIMAKGKDLELYPYIPTFMKAWKRFYPESTVLH